MTQDQVVSEGAAPAEQVDVVVVGARVAGATLAALLGDAGARVLLVDRASFPSATLSTHFFRGCHAVSDHLLGLGVGQVDAGQLFDPGRWWLVERPQDLLTRIHARRG